MVDHAAAAIRLSAVSHSYPESEGKRMVLDGVDLSIGRGELVAIEGRSGSGKSTLLNLVAGIDLPDSGLIEILGERIDELDEHGRTLFRRRNVGFVFQSFNLVPTLTVEENLMFPLELNKVARDEAQERINSLLEDFALDGRGQAFPDQLSGGEQQRVAIARAIVHRPGLVLADEPTGNLDRDTETQILSILGDLPASHDVTLVTATHSPEIASIADRRLFLSGGRLSAE